MRKYPVICFLLLLGWFNGIGQSGSAYAMRIDSFRSAYLEDFIQNPVAPLDSQHLRHVHFFTPDSTYRITGRFERTRDAKPFELPTYSGITKPFVQYGWFHFPWTKDSLQLAVYQSVRWRKVPGYKDQLFIPFKDATNGETTYGGGRYLDISTQDITGNTLTLDFNKAYNPWCAYSDGYNCPIPPTENQLPVSINAGEKKYTGPKLQRPK